MKIAFTTLGCKLNYAETSTYRRGLAKYGYEPAEWDEKADAYIVNTCAVTVTAEKKSRNLIRKAHKLSPSAPIIVTGCYAELQKEAVSAIEGVVKVFGSSDKGGLVEWTRAYLEGRSVALSADQKPVMSAFSSDGRTRAFLKVQDGCDNFCAYCTVPFARGRSRNIPVSELVAQAGEIASGGRREIVITGVNTGDFGRTTGESFLDLLKALDKVEGIERYRISSVEPNLLTEDIIDWIASGTKFQPHFHIPLQSGSDTILKKVGRRYDTALFSSRIDYIRKVMEKPGGPKVFFGIDVIAGLPGETEELFMETWDFLKNRIRPAFIHVFPYSPRPGTRAAAMKDQVRDYVKTERVARLEQLCRGLHESFVADNRGVSETVLWESTEKDGLMSGYTGNYIRVSRPFDESLVGSLQKIVL